MTSDPEQRVDDVNYASIQFGLTAEQERSLYSNTQRVQRQKQNYEVVYDSVQLQSNTAT